MKASEERKTHVQKALGRGTHAGGMKRGQKKRCRKCPQTPVEMAAVETTAKAPASLAGPNSLVEASRNGAKFWAAGEGGRL